MKICYNKNIKREKIIGGMRMKGTKNDKGITLIALIITIIILMVLAGVSIGIAIDDDFTKKAKDTVDKTNERLEEQNNQQEDTKNAWDQLPGKIVKSSTSE